MKKERQKQRKQEQWKIKHKEEEKKKGEAETGVLTIDTDFSEYSCSGSSIRTITVWDNDHTVQALVNAENISIIPGYGLILSQCQSLVVEIAMLLRKKGKNVRFGIHPSAGWKPGELDEIFTGAGLLYDVVQDIDELNEDFAYTDIPLVIGANDIVNPAAEDNPNLFCAGKPVLKVWKSSQTVMMKRTLDAGSARVDNSIFYFKNNAMLFGNAKESCDGILKGLNKYFEIE